MFVSSQEIRLDARPSSSSSSSAAGNNSPSTLQEQFLESQKLQLNDCAKEWTSSYDTIELLKQSLKQLSTLTQQQAAAEQVVLNHSEGVASTPSPAFYHTIENFDIQPLYVASRSKTLSRRGSFSSQYSTGSSKSVRFGNVSIVQDLVAAQIVTTVDDFEQRARKQQQQTTKQQPDNRLDEYVQMVQSTRQRKRTNTEGESTTTKPQLTRANSSSALDDKKARTFSLFRKKQDNLNAAVLQASLQESSHPDSSASMASASRASRSSQRSQQRSSSRSISKLFAKTFGRRKGPQANSNNNDNSNHAVDISEVTMDDTVTETSSNDDSGAIVKTDARYKQQPQRRNTRKQNSSVPEQPPSRRRRGVSRQNSGASTASASSGIVRIAARLLSRRSSNNSDISSMASSIGSEVGHVEYIPPQQIVVSSEPNEETRSSSPSSLPDDDDDEVVNEDAVQLQNEIANLKKQLMGLVMEHMEESELRKEQQGMKYKQVVVAKS